MVMNRRSLERARAPRRRSKGRSSFLCKDGSSANIKVVIRVRPPNSKESEEGNFRPTVKVLDDKMLIFDPKDDEEDDGFFYYQGVKQRDFLKRPRKEIKFMFDQVYGFESSNEEVFEGTTKSIVSSLFDGYNCSVFVYGATGAGKTFTMLGNPQNPGITLLTMEELYSKIEEVCNEKACEIGVSYLEVYNENVRDLIQSSGVLQLREDGIRGVMVQGLSVHRPTGAQELFDLLELGNSRRTQHPTDSNAESSRSHAVLEIKLRMTDLTTKQKKMAKLLMIDLAGSERGSATGFKGSRFQEGSNINKSLLSLGNCINGLADGLKHIPYRNSKLTRLLKDSLGGNCRTIMIANVSPSPTSYEDTYNTLRYADRAKKIKTKVSKNVVSMQMHVNEYLNLIGMLKKENQELKQQLQDANKRAEEQKSAHLSSYSPEFCSKESVKLQDELMQCFRIKRSFHGNILKLESNERIFNMKIILKQQTAKHLNILSRQPRKLKITLDKIERTIRGLEAKIHKIKELKADQWQKHKANEDKIADLTTKLCENFELQATKVGNKIIKEMSQNVYKEDLEFQVKHMKNALAMQQKDQNRKNQLIEDLCRTIRQYHIYLEGHNITTASINDEYERLVRQLEGVKDLAWADLEQSKDGDKNKSYEEFGSNFFGSLPLSPLNCTYAKVNELEELEELDALSENVQPRRLPVVERTEVNKMQSPDEKAETKFVANLDVLKSSLNSENEEQNVDSRFNEQTSVNGHSEFDKKIISGFTCASFTVKNTTQELQCSKETVDEVDQHRVEETGLLSPSEPFDPVDKQDSDSEDDCNVELFHVKTLEDTFTLFEHHKDSAETTFTVPETKNIPTEPIVTKQNGECSVKPLPVENRFSFIVDGTYKSTGTSFALQPHHVQNAREDSIANKENRIAGILKKKPNYFGEGVRLMSKAAEHRDYKYQGRALWSAIPSTGGRPGSSIQRFMPPPLTRPNQLPLKDINSLKGQYGSSSSGKIRGIHNTYPRVSPYYKKYQAADKPGSLKKPQIPTPIFLWQSIDDSTCYYYKFCTCMACYCFGFQHHRHLSMKVTSKSSSLSGRENQ